MEAGGGGRDWTEILVQRGLSRPVAERHAASFAAQQIENAVAYFDQQTGVGAGVLDLAIREARVPVRKQSAGLEREAQYAADVVAWLRKHFPEFDRPVWGPHPAAIGAVVRLHGRDGKGTLSRSAHGPEIRAAVKAWDDRWGAE